MVKFKPGLSLVLSKVFLSKDMHLEQKKDTVEALPRDTIMTTQKDTLSNMQEGKTK